MDFLVHFIIHTRPLWLSPVSPSHENASSKSSENPPVLHSLRWRRRLSGNETTVWISRHSIVSSMHFVISDSSTRWRSRVNASYSPANVIMRLVKMLSRSASARTVERSMMLIPSSQAPISRAWPMPTWSHVMGVYWDRSWHSGSGIGNQDDKKEVLPTKGILTIVSPRGCSLGLSSNSPSSQEWQTIFPNFAFLIIHFSLDYALPSPHPLPHICNGTYPLFL